MKLGINLIIYHNKSRKDQEESQIKCLTTLKIQKKMTKTIQSLKITIKILKKMNQQLWLKNKNMD